MELMNDSLFLDSSFFKALVDIKDDFHPQAVSLWQKIEKTSTQLITTNFILDETLTLIRVKCGYSAVMDFRNRLEVGLKRMRIIRVLIKDEVAAWQWFMNDWSKLSFTDCVSFAVMKRLGLTRVATFDPHFAKAGFKIER